MKVQDFMTRDVVTVRPDAPIHEAARLMVNHGVSGLPVLDEGGRLVGILSEGDLILRQKPRTQLAWWQVFFSDGERLAREYQKATGLTVAEVMTRSVISLPPDASIESAAALLDEHKIRRVPVVAAGKLAGIISRGDLIKALAGGPAGGRAPLSDEQLVSEMQQRMRAESWVSHGNVAIHACGGIITLFGIVDTQAERSALETMARAIPGCKGADDQLLLYSQVVVSGA